jgi:hypothetical protein
MGTTFSQNISIPSADVAYSESKKNMDLNNQIDQEIKNTHPFHYDRFNILYSQTYEDCKARIMVAMMLGHTHTKCLDIGIDNERTLIKSGYNLSENFKADAPPCHLRVSWSPETTESTKLTKNKN